MLTVLALSRDPARRRALPHRHRAADALLPAWRAGQPRADAWTSKRSWAASDADEMKIGVRTARDLTWKDGLDAFTCTECGRCKDACPTFLTGKPLALKWVYDSLKQHLLAQRDAIVAGDDAALPRSGRRSHRAGDALGVHDVRLLRGRVSDRARAPAALLPHAPASGADGRRVSARAQGRVRRLRGAEQSVGAAGRYARRIGRTGSAFPSCRRPRTCRPSTTCSTSARRSRSIRARKRSRSRSSRSSSTPACGSGFSARARRRPASACAAPATKCCSSSSRGRWSTR